MRMSIAQQRESEANLRRRVEAALSNAQVAQRWKENRAGRSGNMKTDGKDIWSYQHRIGETWPDGTKIAYSCRYSQTTAQHSWAAKSVVPPAQVWRVCPTCHREFA